MKCNICNSELREVGYVDEGYQHYICPNSCDFEFSAIERVKSKLNEIISIGFLAMMIILTVPIWVPIQIKDKIKGGYLNGD